MCIAFWMRKYPQSWLFTLIGCTRFSCYKRWLSQKCVYCRNLVDTGKYQLLTVTAIWVSFNGIGWNFCGRWVPTSIHMNLLLPLIIFWCITCTSVCLWRRDSVKPRQPNHVISNLLNIIKSHLTLEERRLRDTVFFRPALSLTSHRGAHVMLFSNTSSMKSLMNVKFMYF